jgi:hypothetical protein
MPHRATCQSVLHISGIIASLACTPAAARAVDQTLADVAQAQAVSERAKMKYQPAEISLGASTLRLSVDDRILYDDNVYDAQQNRVSDALAIVAPKIAWQTRTDSFTAGLVADASIERYASLTTEDANQYKLTANGQWDTGGDITLGASGFIGRHHELRGTLGDIVVGAPSQYDNRGGTVDLGILVGPVLLQTGGGVQTLKYLPVELQGQTISEAYRDRTIYTANASANMPLSPSLRAFARGDFNAQAYQHTDASADQNSHGYAVTTGLALGLDELISGQVAIGYLAQKYADTALGTVSGITYNARLTWNPTPLVTATLNGGRTLQQSPFFAQGGVIEDSVNLQIDYWPLEKLIVSAAERMTFDDFRGINRIDRRFVSDVLLRYLLSRRLELGLQANYRDQASQGNAARPYTGASLTLDLMVRL